MARFNSIKIPTFIFALLVYSQAPVSAVPGDFLFEIPNPTPGTADVFGFAVATFSGNVVVGAPGDDTDGPDEGSVYRFDQAGVQQFPRPANPTPSPFGHEVFGGSVSVWSGHIAVGAPNDYAAGPETGAAHLFDASGTFLQTIPNPTPDQFDQFGFSVSLADGFLVVGAWGDDTDGPDAGYAYRYDLNDPMLTPFPIPNPSVNALLFGESVSISCGYILVGAPGSPMGGAAYLYLDSNPSVPVAVIPNPAPAYGDRFGESVSVADGYAVIGAPGTGHAYVYDLSNNLSNLGLPVTLGSGGGSFGASVSTANGYFVVGAPLDGTFGPGAGQAFLYEANGNLVQSLLKPTQQVSGDYFGGAVAMRHGYVVIGTTEDTNDPWASVYVFEGPPSSTQPTPCETCPTLSADPAVCLVGAGDPQYSLMLEVYNPGDPGELYLDVGTNLISPNPLSIPLGLSSWTITITDQWPYDTDTAIAGVFSEWGSTETCESLPVWVPFPPCGDCADCEDCEATNYWPGDTHPQDVIGSVNGAHPSGLYEPGLLADAFQFDGTNKFEAPLSHSGPFTVAFWVKSLFLNQLEWTGILSSSGQVVTPSFQVDFSAAEEYRLSLTNGAGNFFVPIGPASVDFQHIAVTFDGVEVTTYLNGAPQGNLVTALDINLLKVGENRSGTLPFEGVVDEVRFYDYALPDSCLTDPAVCPVLSLDAIECVADDLSGISYPFQVSVETPAGLSGTVTLQSADAQVIVSPSPTPVSSSSTTPITGVLVPGSGTSPVQVVAVFAGDDASQVLVCLDTLAIVLPECPDGGCLQVIEQTITVVEAIGDACVYEYWAQLVNNSSYPQPANWLTVKFPDGTKQEIELVPPVPQGDIFEVAFQFLDVQVSGKAGDEVCLQLQLHAGTLDDAGEVEYDWCCPWQEVCFVLPECPDGGCLQVIEQTITVVEAIGDACVYEYWAQLVNNSSYPQPANWLTVKFPDGTKQEIELDPPVPQGDIFEVAFQFLDVQVLGKAGDEVCLQLQLHADTLNDAGEVEHDWCCPWQEVCFVLPECLTCSQVEGVLDCDEAQLLYHFEVNSKFADMSRVNVHTLTPSVSVSPNVFTFTPSSSYSNTLWLSGATPGQTVVLVFEAHGTLDEGAYEWCCPPDTLVVEIPEELCAVGKKGKQAKSANSLAPPMPNPANPETTIRYRIAEDAYVTLRIYDSLGRVVATEVDQWQPAGQYSRVFAPENLASGVYFYRIEAGAFTQIQKMTILK